MEIFVYCTMAFVAGGMIGIIGMGIVAGASVRANMARIALLEKEADYARRYVEAAKATVKRGANGRFVKRETGNDAAN